MPKWSKIDNTKKLHAVTAKADDDIPYAQAEEYDTKWKMIWMCHVWNNPEIEEN